MSQHKRTHSEMMMEDPQKPNNKNVTQLRMKYQSAQRNSKRYKRELEAAKEKYNECEEIEKKAKQEYKEYKLNQPIGPKKHGKKDLIYLRTLKADDIRDKKIKEYWGNGSLTYKGQYLFHRIFMFGDLYDYLGDDVPIYLSYNRSKDSFMVSVRDDSFCRFMPLSMDSDGYVTFSNLSVGTKLDQLCDTLDYKMTDEMRQEDYYKNSDNTFWISCGKDWSRNLGTFWRHYSPEY